MNAKIMTALAGLALMTACASDDAATSAAAGAGGAGGAFGAGAGGVGAARPGSQEDLVANVGDRVLFETDSSVVPGDGRATLERQAAWFGRYPQVTAVIEGHADERGTREYNLALGQRRANAARDLLVAGGVSGQRVQTVSYGKDRPAQLGPDDAAWAQNRRAVTTVR